MEGYETKDWELYKKSLISRFEAQDERTHTISRLKTLVAQYAANPEADDLEGYVREFKKISEVLVAREIMTRFTQMKLIFEGLPPRMIKEVNRKHLGLAEALDKEDNSFAKGKDRFNFLQVCATIHESGVAQKYAERLTHDGNQRRDKEIYVHVPERHPEGIKKTTYKNKDKETRDDVDELRKMFGNLALQIDNMAHPSKPYKEYGGNNGATTTPATGVNKIPLKCFGCMEAGHTMTRPTLCPKLQPFMDKGDICINN